MKKRRELAKKIFMVCIAFVLSLGCLNTSGMEASAANDKVQTIINYARSKMHSAAYSGYCQAFVKECYEAAGIYASPNAGSADEARNRWCVSRDLSNIPVGACVYWKTNHVAIYLGNDRIIHTVSGVYDNSSVDYVCETSLSYFTQRDAIYGWGYQAGYDLYANGGTSTPVTAKFATSGVATEITETSAVITAHLDGIYWVSTCGVDFGTSAQSMTRISENPNKNVQNIFYSLGNSSDWSSTLTPGTTYYYQFFAIIGGVEYRGDLCQFTTAGKMISLWDINEGDVLNSAQYLCAKRSDRDANHYAEFYIDENLISGRLTADEEGYFRLWINPNDYTMGNHVLKVKYYNTNGMWEDSKTISTFLNIGDVRYIFADVDSAWYTNYVQYVYDNDLMTGMKGTKLFKPNANITKAQVAQVLYNMEGQPTDVSLTVFKQLTDVSVNEWYADAVAWAYSAGVITGNVNAKKFFPNADVTREQLAMMMYRYAKFKGYDTTSTSTLEGLQNAENTATWAVDGVKWAVGEGLISGVEKNGVKDLSPQGNASRAQVAAILQRFCEAYGL